MFVLVTVEPAGVVAIPHARERELVIFNIGNLGTLHSIYCNYQLLASQIYHSKAMRNLHSNS